MEQLDLLAILRTICAHRKGYIYAFFITVVFTLVVYFGTHNTYKSESTLAPELENLSASSMGSLAALAGINIGNAGTDGDAIGPDLYPQIAVSTPFIVELLQEKVTFTRDDEQITCTLYDYFAKHQIDPWWSVVVSTPIKEIKRLIQGDKPSTLGDSLVIYRLSLEQQKLIAGVASCIDVIADKEVTMYHLSVTTQDPEVSAAMNTLVLNLIQKYIIDYRTKKERINLETNQRLQAEAYAKYLSASKKYADYADSHQNSVLATVGQAESVLENEVQKTYQAYTALSLRVQQNEEKLQARTPAFSIIEQPIVPVLKCAPKLTFMMLGNLFLVMFGFTMYIIFTPYVKDVFRKL